MSETEVLTAILYTFIYIYIAWLNKIYLYNNNHETINIYVVKKHFISIELKYVPCAQYTLKIKPEPWPRYIA